MDAVRKLPTLVACVLVGSCGGPPPARMDSAGVDVEAERLRALGALERECPRGNADCDVAGTKLTPSASAAPAGAAGFELAMSDTEAERRCRAAGELWSAEKTVQDETASCSGSVGTRPPFRVDMQLCGGNVCRRPEASPGCEL